MVRRRQRARVQEYEHVLVFREADWPGGCVQERYWAWEREWYRVFDEVKRLQVPLGLELIRAKRDARRRHLFAHEPCECCASERVSRAGVARSGFAFGSASVQYGE